MNIVHSHWYFTADELEGKGLDAVSVHMEAFPREGKEGDPTGAPFHLNIRCFGRTWTTYFSGPVGEPQKFVRSCDDEYLVDRLIQLDGMKNTFEKRERAYLKRIINAVKPLLVTVNEKQAQYLQTLIDGVEPVDYKQPEQAPRFDRVVVCRFIGDDQLYGPAPAEQFNWNHAEGVPNIDMFWLIPGERVDFPAAEVH